MEPFSDIEQLIELCKAGNRQAQKAMYDRYAPSMYALCMRYIGDDESAKDLLQDGFVKAFSSLGDYRGTGIFVGWLRKLFVTTALEHLRKNRPWQQSVPIDQMADLLPTESDDVAARLSADELLQSIAALPDRYRAIFNLAAIEGYSHSEIAAMLRIKESSSRSEFSRARKMLQKVITERK